MSKKHLVSADSVLHSVDYGNYGNNNNDHQCIKDLLWDENWGVYVDLEM